MRRSRGKIGVTVQFTFSISLESGCEIHEARGDADVLIVQTVLKSATEQETVLVGDDTYLLVLLIYHAKNVSHTVYFRAETKRLHAGTSRNPSTSREYRH